MNSRIFHEPACRPQLRKCFHFVALCSKHERTLNDGTLTCGGSKRTLLTEIPLIREYVISNNTTNSALVLLGVYQAAIKLTLSIVLDTSKEPQTATAQVLNVLHKQIQIAPVACVLLHKKTQS